MKMTNSSLGISCIACVVGLSNVAFAEKLCPRVEAQFSGVLSNSASPQDLAVANRKSDLDIPEFVIPLPEGVNKGRPGFVFRFVRVAEDAWVLEGRSPELNEDASKPVQFVSPLAVVRFNGQGEQIGDETVKAYMPFADNNQLKAEFVITLRDLAASDGRSDLKVSIHPAVTQTCPEVGITDVTEEEAKQRTRIFDAEGHEVTNAGYDEFGPLSSVE